MINVIKCDKSGAFFRLIPLMGPPIVMFISGVVLLFGWIYRISWFQNLDPQFPAMVPSTALSLYILAYLTIKLKITFPDRDVIADTVLISVVLVIAVMNILMTILGGYAGIDGLFLIDLRRDGSQEMALATSLCLLLASICILIIYFKSSDHRLVKIISFLGFLISLLNLLGYIYSVQWLLVKGFYESMAIHTAFSFVVLFPSFYGLHLVLNNDDDY